MARIFSWKIDDEFAYLGKADQTPTWFHQTEQIVDKNILSAISQTVLNYSEDTYRTQFNDMATWAAMDKSVSLDPWTSYFNVTGSLLMLTGADGEEGKKGDKGDKGDSGAKGDTGEKGDTGTAGKGRNIMCFRSTDTTVMSLSAPIGGTYDPNTGDIVYPKSPSTESGTTWSASSEFGSNLKVWMTNAYFGNDPGGPITSSTRPNGWVTPICISGPKGDNGADGLTTEFVYKRTTGKQETDKPTTPTGTTKTEAIAQGWTDHPKGVGEDTGVMYAAEWMSMHTKNTDGTWTTWSEPALWSTWGEDGMDGDGIEYLFAITTQYAAPSVTTLPQKVGDKNPDVSANWQEPEIWDYILNHYGPSEYSYNDIDKSGVTITRYWTDNPTNVNVDNQYEWVSIRRRKWDSVTETSEFGPFSTPILWAHYGKDGEKGNDGTSITIKGKYDRIYDILCKLGTTDFPPQNGDSFTLPTTDISGNTVMHIWVWMQLDGIGGRTNKYTPTATPSLENYEDGTWYYEDTTVTPNTYWWFTDCGRFSGEDGKSAYIHQKYAMDWDGVATEHVKTNIHKGKTILNNVDIMFTDQSSTIKGEIPGPYFAQYSDNVFDDRTDLQYYCDNDLWTVWGGNDGQSFGQEQIFFRTKTNTQPATTILSTSGHGYFVGDKILNVAYTNDCFKIADWVPSNWTDTPQGLQDGVYNFEWVAVRRLIDKTNDTIYGGQWSYFSEPKIYAMMSDSEFVQVEYTTYDADDIATAYTGFTKFTGKAYPLTSSDETTWRTTAPQNAFGTWSDNGANAKWKLVCYAEVQNGQKSVDGETVWSDWKIERIGKGDKGDKGIKGATVRGPYLWGSGDGSLRMFYNGEENTTYPESKNWIDVILLRNGGTDTYYKCKTTYQGKLTDNWDSVKNNWETGITYDFVATNLLMAESAKINFLSNNSLYLLDTNSHIIGGGKGADNNNDVVFWAGSDFTGGTDTAATKTEIDKSPFRVLKNGHVYMSDCDISGNIASGNSKFIQAKNGELTFFDNGLSTETTLTSNGLTLTGRNGTEHYESVITPINVGFIYGDSHFWSKLTRLGLSFTGPCGDDPSKRTTCDINADRLLYAHPDGEFEIVSGTMKYKNDNVVCSSDVVKIKKVTALPSSPDPNTLYIIVQ